MFRREYLSSYIKHGLLSAALFCIPMVYYVYAEAYRNTWLLFLGNVLFLVGIFVYMLNFNKMKNENPSTQTMVAAGHIATGVGIIASCIVAVIAIAVFVPGVFGSGPTDKVLEDAPSQTGTGATHGMIFFVFMNAIIGNVCAGSFPSIILPYTAKRNQTKDKKSEVLNN